MLTHMAYSYYTSPFDQSTLLAIDGRGDFSINTAYGLGEKNKLTYLGNTNWSNKDKITYNNIGITYSLSMISFPIFRIDPLSSAGKAMGLSSYGILLILGEKTFKMFYFQMIYLDIRTNLICGRQLKQL